VNKLGDSRRKCDKAKQVQIARCATLGFFFIIQQESNHYTNYYYSYMILPCNTNTN
jgi:hypothetical protein